MTPRIPANIFTWQSFASTAVPPRDPNDDDEEEEDDDGEADEDREPAVIREPDEDSFSDGSESISKDREFRQHRGKPLDERLQPRLRHGWDQVVEHAALAEQRIGASLGRC